MNTKNDFLAQLNPQQLQAVQHQPSPLMILAGAGSGKTRVLTTRIIHMIHSGISPHEILAVTFTNKAAREMKDRVARQVDAPVLIGTFHAICLGILRRHAARMSLRNDFTIYDDQDQLAVIKECMKELDIEEKTLSPKYVRERISRSKDQLQTARDAALGSADEDDRLFAAVYQKYEEKLRLYNGLDFGDLIAKTVALFAGVPDVLEEYRARFRHVLVDEYQDTNHAQSAFIKLLAAKSRSITVVGDPDQSIYEWRGASAANMLNFEKEYKGAMVIRLEQNYRSTNTILKAANAVIAHNLNRKPKNLWSERGDGQRIELYKAPNDRMEAMNLIDTVFALKKEGYRLNDMAGFYRTHSQSRLFEEELRRNRIPYAIVGGVKFYSRKEIKDLLAYMTVTYNPGDEVNLARIINTPKRAIGKEAVDKLKRHARKEGIPLFEAIGRLCKDQAAPARLKKSLEQFHAMIRHFHDIRGMLPLSALLQAIIDTTGYVAALEHENTIDAKARIENIREFYASVKEFEESLRGEEHVNVLQAYLEFISLQTNMDGWQDGDQAFTLMTLHCAKGLEFPVVFMLGMEEGLLPHANALNGDLDELEEERRLCYVGFTRAKDRLHLSYAVQRRTFGFTKRQHPSRFLYEIPAKLLASRLDSYSAYAGDGLDDEEREEEKFEYI
ncbi:MAG: hypothetical protein A3C36_00520 [Omnitrophica WOR_2 bacterium RIFCSPHIGHO2_02_FULL_52_10]|nr:MAG: hypothetical protein A3C36_00520 [Omnitrophica WOR_2 bacterium RIFCSPHIGHO2_02_FULL_52_10]